MTKNDGAPATPSAPPFRTRVRSPWTAVCLLLFIFIIYKSISSYEQHQLIRDFQGAYHQGTASWVWDSKMDRTDRILFPLSFPDQDLPNYIQKQKLYPLSQVQNAEVKKHQPTENAAKRLRRPLKMSEFQRHDLDVFHSSANIQLDLLKCESRLYQRLAVGVDKPRGINVSLRTVLTQLLAEIEHNPYFKELAPFFIDELALQIKYNVVEHYWYRLAGSLVYLEEYGVHFMISRVLYSPRGARNQPIISLTYAQLFDENWNELTNTKLAVPDGPAYRIMEFPSFLPIPFWFDVDNTDGKFYGPEDPRILLVKNKQGFPEPVVIFNAYHRKMTHFDDDADDHLILKPTYYRSMFMCWPWQTQKGKENTDGLASEEFRNSVYSKVVELQIRNIDRRTKQKNWTPFVSEADRAVRGYDTHLNFIYRWANLEVLKCEMATGECVFTYRLNDRLSTSARVGPLRGGTQLININGLLQEEAAKMIPANREIWVGFARAHLDKCGCGNVMYRPNLVVLVKDLVGSKQMFRLSHVSSSISFDVPIIGWDLNNPKDLCHGTNVLIPNGISSWLVVLAGEGDGTFVVDDVVTLSLSISDFTVHKINIKGLLNLMLSMEANSLFLTPQGSDMKRLLIPNPKIVHDPEKVDSQWLTGFNNDNVACAMLSSTEFCAAYGYEQDQVYKSIYGDEYEFEDEEFIEQQDALSVDKYELELGMHHFGEKINKPPTRQRVPYGLVNEYGKFDKTTMGALFNGTIFADDEKAADKVAEKDASIHRNSSKSYGRPKMAKPLGALGLEKTQGKGGKNAKTNGGKIAMKGEDEESDKGSESSEEVSGEVSGISGTNKEGTGKKTIKQKGKSKLKPKPKIKDQDLDDETPEAALNVKPKGKPVKETKETKDDEELVKDKGTKDGKKKVVKDKGTSKGEKEATQDKGTKKKGKKAQT